MSDLARDCLIYGNSGVNIGGTFLEPYPRQENTGAARMIAAAISSGIGAGVIQAAEHLKELPNRGQRLERAAEFKFLAGSRLATRPTESRRSGRR